MYSQRVSHYVSLLAVALIFLFLSNPLHAATISLQLSQNPVQAGDSLQLRFTANGATSGEPDWSPLQQYFDISGRSVSQSVSIVNGERSDTKTWTLTVFPREAGEITIPPIRFGQDQSQVMILKVVDSLPQTSGKNGVGNGAGNDVFVEMEVLTKQSYVQQQSIIVQRLFHTGFLSNAQLTAPEVEQGKADILQLGKNRTMVEERNGRSYQVVERRYAVFPLNSGTVKIGRTVFDGVLTPGGRAQQRDPFGMRGKRLRRYSKPFTIEVQPQPANVKAATWLPAKDITLNAHWQTPPDKLKAGEPVTLTLAIVADGLTAQQLPAITLETPVGIKAYTDKPELRNEPNASGMVGVRQEKWVLVGTNNGEYVLPEIRLAWWNTETKQEAVARVAETTLVVSGGTGAAANQPASPQFVPSESQALLSPDLEKPLPMAKAGAAEATGLSAWLWGVLAAIGLSIVGLLMWLRMRTQTQSTLGQASVHASDGAADHWQLLMTACEQQQPSVVQAALLDWVKYELQLKPPYLVNLRHHANSDALNQALDDLNGAAYANERSDWHSRALLTALKVFKNKTPEVAKNDSLPALYPD